MMYKSRFWMMIVPTLSLLAACGQSATPPTTTSTIGASPTDLPTEKVQVIQNTAKTSAQGLAESNQSSYSPDRLKAMDASIKLLEEDLATRNPQLLTRITENEARNQLLYIKSLYNELVKQSKIDHAEPLKPQWYVSNPTTTLTISNVALSSIVTFQSYRNIRSQYPYNVFDWTNNGCSSPFGSGALLGIDQAFLPACEVHDFGYRNGTYYKELQTLDFKHRVDDNFYQNMLSLCDSGTVMPQSNCYRDAFVYYTFIRGILVENGYMREYGGPGQG